MDQGLGNLVDPCLIIKSVAQAAHQNGQPIALVSAVSIDETGIAQGFQDSIDGGAG
jgi:hypothetical protein